MAKENTTPKAAEENAIEETLQKEETVTIGKSELEAILERLSKLEEKKPEQGDTQKALSEKSEEILKRLKELDERVEYRANLRGNNGDKSDIFVCINGKAMQIKRGERVEIPKSFKQVLDQADFQEMVAENVLEETVSNSR